MLTMPEAKTTIKAESSLKQTEIPLQTVQVSHSCGTREAGFEGMKAKDPTGFAN